MTPYIAVCSTQPIFEFALGNLVILLLILIKWHKRTLWGHNLGINIGPATLINNVEDYLYTSQFGSFVEGYLHVSRVRVMDTRMYLKGFD